MARHSSKTKSKLTRSERIERATELYAQGWFVADVARDLKVARNTAVAYKEIYERRLKEEVDANPQFLQDIIGNTARMIQELEYVRRNAAKEYQRAEKPIKVECPRCEHGFKIPNPDADTRNKLLKTILAVQESRAKMFGAMGIKAEYAAMVANVQRVQAELIKFMQDTLCESDQAKLLAFLTSPDMAPLMGGKAIEAESWEGEPAEVAS